MISLPPQLKVPSGRAFASAHLLLALLLAHLFWNSLRIHRLLFASLSNSWQLGLVRLGFQKRLIIV
jgi:hypothetical protein